MLPLVISLALAVASPGDDKPSSPGQTPPKPHPLAPSLRATTEEDEDKFDRIIDRFEVTPRQLIIYLRELAPNRPLVISYRLKAIVAADVTVPAGRVYEYYDPTSAGRGKTSRLTVTPKPNRP